MEQTIELENADLEKLSEEFRVATTKEAKLYFKFTKADADRWKGGFQEKDYDKYVAQLDAWYLARQAKLEIFRVAMKKMGFKDQPPEGQVRIFRGVEWPWDTKKINPNSYWIEDPEFALDFAKMGDLVVLEIPEKEIYRVKDLMKAGEIQLPNPDSATDARLIIRNGRFVEDPAKPPSPNIQNLLMSILNDRNSAPKKYDMVHDEYLKMRD